MRNTVFVLAFLFISFAGSEASAQTIDNGQRIESTFRTLNECKEAFETGQFKVYQSVHQGNARFVSHLPTKTLDGYACVRQDVVNGVGPNYSRYTIQDNQIKFVVQNGVITHRADCGNKVYDVVPLVKSETYSTIVNKCPEGSTWDPAQKICFSMGKETIICPQGYTWESKDQMCVLRPQKAIICPEGYVYNEKVGGKCTIMAETANCPKGDLWDPHKNKCVDKGMGTGKVVLIAIGAGVGGFVLGKVLDNCGSKCDAVKTLPGGSSSPHPGRPIRTAGWAPESQGQPLSSGIASSTSQAPPPCTGQLVMLGGKLDCVNN